MDFGGRNGLFHERSFLALLYAVGNIAFWGPWLLRPPGSAPVLLYIMSFIGLFCVSLIRCPMFAIV